MNVGENIRFLSQNLNIVYKHSKNRGEIAQEKFAKIFFFFRKL